MRGLGSAPLRRRAMRGLAGRALCAITAGLIVVGGVARRATAQEPEAPPADAGPQVVRVEVALIYGSAQDGEVDKRLEGLRKFFASQLMPMRFGTLRMMSLDEVQLHCGEWGAIELPADGEALADPPEAAADAEPVPEPGSEDTPAPGPRIRRTALPLTPRPDREFVRFLPIQIVDRRLHLHFQMPRMDTRLQLRSGRPLIAGGPPYQDGLIIVQLTPTFESQAVPRTDDPQRDEEPQLQRGPRPAPRAPGRWVNDRRPIPTANGTAPEPASAR